MSELVIKERVVGEKIVILDCTGRIYIGEGTIAIRMAVRLLIEKGRPNIILNLSGISYIDGSGIGELVSSYAAITKAEGNLKLLHLPQKLQHLLAITKLLRAW